MKAYMIFSDKPGTAGMGLTGMGTGMVPGTEICIRTRTHDTHTRVPAGYIRTRVQHYRWTPVDSSGPPPLDYGQNLITSESSPVDSGGLQWTPSSGLWSKFNYIRVQSGGLRWTPLDPPSLDYSQFYFILFQRTPADSSGSPM
jgi:hypothetical protein